MTISDIKAQARAVLRGLSGKYALFCLPILLTILTAGLSVYQTLLDLGGIQVRVSASYSPLLISYLLDFFVLSVSFIMLDVIRHQRQTVQFTDNTYAFNRAIFMKLLVLLVLRWIYLFLLSLLPAFGFLLVGLGTYLLGNTITLTAIILLVIGILVTVIGLTIVIQRQYAYSMAPYLLYDHLEDNRYSSARAILSQSVTLMKGKKWKFFLLELSFIGWYFLVPLTMGLIYFYVFPYNTTAHLIFYNQLVADN
ncbi:DUF975 family protein [Streptococcus sp. HF-1907]|uniref:DUF975 family protein n=1 Tax=Streptococcus sp. HF-1907 TaxID=2785793 RepID=UPI00189DF212|nr:DUF975 family protein [Streptococcus sp. HF-1907]MBF7094998.1 DUF975 family protein [Streptococcus sp. HF-1907]